MITIKKLCCEFRRGETVKACPLGRMEGRGADAVFTVVAGFVVTHARYYIRPPSYSPLCSFLGVSKVQTLFSIE